jgi:hypothetical protein
MAITLGRLGSLDAPFGDNIINITKTVESDTVDVSNRDNTGEGYRVSMAGLKSVTWEIECHDVDTALTNLTTPTSGDGSAVTVTNVTENINVDGAVTYTITARGGQ